MENKLTKPLHNRGKRSIGYSGGAIAPNKSAKVEIEEADKLLALYPDELTDVKKDLGDDDAEKLYKEKIALLETTLASEKEKVAELTGKLQGVVEVDETVKALEAEIEALKATDSSEAVKALTEEKEALEAKVVELEAMVESLTAPDDDAEKSEEGAKAPEPETKETAKKGSSKK